MYMSTPPLLCVEKRERSDVLGDLLGPHINRDQEMSGNRLGLVQSSNGIITRYSRLRCCLDQINASMMTSAKWLFWCHMSSPHKPIQVNITLVTFNSSTTCDGLILSLLVMGEVSNATIDKAYSKSMYSLSMSKHQGRKYQISCFLKVSTIML